jgi:hypothetical protein
MSPIEILGAVLFAVPLIAVGVLLIAALYSGDS